MANPPPFPPPGMPVPQSPKPKSKVSIVLVVVGLFVAFLVFRIVQMAILLPKHMRERQSQPGYSELQAAEKSIVSNRDGVAHGNTKEAAELATAISKDMRQLREAMFEKGKGDNVLLSHGDFLVVCELHKDKCAVIMHVPELRRFTDEAKAGMMELAYATVCRNLDALPDPQPRQVAVATKGDLFYDRLTIGDYTPKDKTPLTHAHSVDLKSSTTTAHELEQFFVPEAPQP